LNYCEPCCTNQVICQNNLGVKLYPLLYGNTILTAYSTQKDYKEIAIYDQKICLLHFSPELLLNKYYHLNTEQNGGFVISDERMGKTYTDANIKKLSSTEYFFLENSGRAYNYKFRNYELMIRESFSLDLLRHVTFFNYNHYNLLKIEVNNFYFCSCSTR